MEARWSFSGVWRRLEVGAGVGGVAGGGSLCSGCVVHAASRRGLQGISGEVAVEDVEVSLPATAPLARRPPLR